MLTSDLALSWQRGGRTGPRYVETSDAQLLRDAGDLIRIFAEHLGRARAELERALEAHVGTGTDYKILRGLIKLLMDRCEFEVGSALEPAQVRGALFRRARAHHPAVMEEARALVVAETAAELDCAPEDITAALYADLPLNQRLALFDAPEARELLERYNVAQAQALLYRCVEMRLRVAPQSPAGYRELFGAIKAYRLIHTVRGSAEAGYEVSLSGPVSIFHHSQKYGVQMAVFLPALLLCENWTMRAEIATKDRGRLVFEMESDRHELHSHYAKTSLGENPPAEKLSHNWERLAAFWVLKRCGEVIHLGESAFVPDFELTDAAGRRVYLEILGFWTPSYLRERLEEFAHGKFKNYLIAASDELRGSRDELVRVPPHVVLFKSSLSPAAVEAAANELFATDQIDSRE